MIPREVWFLIQDFLPLAEFVGSTIFFWRELTPTQYGEAFLLLCRAGDTNALDFFHRRRRRFPIECMNLLPIHLQRPTGDDVGYWLQLNFGINPNIHWTYNLDNCLETGNLASTRWIIEHYSTSLVLSDWECYKDFFFEALKFPGGLETVDVLLDLVDPDWLTSGFMHIVLKKNRPDVVEHIQTRFDITFLKRPCAQVDMYQYLCTNAVRSLEWCFRQGWYDSHQDLRGKKLGKMVSRGHAEAAQWLVSHLPHIVPAPIRDILVTHTQTQRLLLSHIEAAQWPSHTQT